MYTAARLPPAVIVQKADYVIAPNRDAFGSKNQMTGGNSFDRLPGRKWGIDLELGGHSARREDGVDATGAVDGAVVFGDHAADRSVQVARGILERVAKRRAPQEVQRATRLIDHGEQPISSRRREDGDECAERPAHHG